MHRLYIRLRSLLRGHEREVTEYVAFTLLLFIISLIVIATYVDGIGMPEKAARGATSVTMPPLAFLAMLAVRRKRQIALGQGAKRWSSQRVTMSIVPHALYFMFVGALGMSYFAAQLVIGLSWGIIALFANYVICHVWSLKETYPPDRHRELYGVIPPVTLR